MKMFFTYYIISGIITMIYYHYHFKHSNSRYRLELYLLVGILLGFVLFPIHIMENMKDRFFNKDE